ncbi:MAG: hypothetical protein AAFN10_18225 [Bacteroidota bacterium]
MHSTKPISTTLFILAGLLIFCSACERFIPPPLQGKYYVKLFGGREPDQGADVIPLPNQQGFLLLGTTNSLGGSDADILLLQTDLEGNQTSEFNLNLGVDQGRSLSANPDGSGFYIGASTLQNDNQDAWVSSLDWNSSNPNWSQVLGSPEGMESIVQVYATSDQHLLVLGSSTQVDPNKNGGNGQATTGDIADIWLVKLNDQGQLLWEKRYGFNGFDAGVSIQEYAGEYYLLATTDFPAPSPQAQVPLLIRLNSEGNIIDRLVLEHGGSQLLPASFAIEPNGDWVILSTSFDGLAQTNLQKVSRDLKNVNEISLPQTDNWAEARKLIQLPNNEGYMIGALQRSLSGAPADIIVRRHAGDGSLQWENRFGYTGADEFGGIIWLGDESFLLSGTLEFANDNTMACLIRTQQDASGNVGP